jgi:pimeloyl-ACP methyl ester carboxylesterase
MRLTRLVAFAVIAACSSWASAADTAPAVTPFAIPKIPALKIDGNLADWQDASGKPLGFRINVFGELAAHPVTDNSPSPTARVAWTDAGLAVCFQVHDATPHENANLATMFDGDSVEVFLSDSAHPKQFFQATISPGTDPEQNKLRVNVHDFRLDQSKPETLTVEAAAAKTADGYIVETLLPFSTLQIKPAEGTKLGLQLHINDKTAAGQVAQYRWKPTYRADKGAIYHQPIVLAAAPSDPIEMAVNPEYQGFRRLRLRVNSALPAWQKLTVNDAAGKELSSITYGGGRGKIDLPFPAAPLGPLTILREGGPVATFTPDAPPARASAADNAKITFKSFAFSGNTFPAPEVDDPLAAEDILGNYQLSVRYFDAGLSEVTKADKPGRYMALVHIRGDLHTCVAIKFDEQKLTAFGVTADLSRAALAQEHKLVAGAQLLMLDVTDPSSIENIVIANAGGRTVRFKDIGEAQFTAEQSAGIEDDRIYTLCNIPAEIKSWREVDFTLKGVEFPKELGVSPEVSGAQSQITAELFKNLLQQDLHKSQNAAVLLASLAEAKPTDAPYLWRNNPAAQASEYDYNLRKKLGILKPYPYLTHVPQDYDADKTKKFPLIIFLHGSGERGNGNVDLLKVTGFPQYLEAHPEFPAVVVSPQCPYNHDWRPQMVNDLLDDALAKYRVDPDRVYMTGLSMGGYGTWTYATFYPNRLAAMLPICGIGDAKDVERIKGIPVWDFHGEVDDAVPIGPDRLCVEALKAAGGKVKFTTYPGVGHDSWTQTYNTPEIYTWLFAQARKPR